MTMSTANPIIRLCSEALEGRHPLGMIGEGADLQQTVIESQIVSESEPSITEVHHLLEILDMAKITTEDELQKFAGSSLPLQTTILTRCYEFSGAWLDNNMVPVWFDRVCIFERGLH